MSTTNKSAIKALGTILRSFRITDFKTVFTLICYIIH